MTLSDFIDQLIELELKLRGEPVNVPVYIVDGRSGVGELCEGASIDKYNEKYFEGGSICDLSKGDKFISVSIG